MGVGGGGTRNVQRAPIYIYIDAFVEKNPGSQCLNPIGTANILRGEGPDLPPKKNGPKILDCKSRATDQKLGGEQFNSGNGGVLILDPTVQQKGHVSLDVLVYPFVISKKNKDTNPTTKKVVVCSKMAIPDVPEQKIRPHSFLPVLLKYLPEAEGINDLKDLVATHHLEALEVRDGWFWVGEGVVDVAHDFFVSKIEGEEQEKSWEKQYKCV